MHQLDRMQTRAELYETIGLAAYESLDSSIAATVLPPDLRPAAE
jgi:methylisocitrate lyase